MSDFIDQTVEIMLGDDDASNEELVTIFRESVEELVRENDQKSYLELMEQYFDMCDIYAYGPWGDSEIMTEPKIGKFWFEVDLRVPKEVDLEGAARLLGKQKENKVLVRKGDNFYHIRVKILRRILDGIESRNRHEAEEEAKDYAPIETPQMPPQEPGGGMGGMGGGF